MRKNVDAQSTANCPGKGALELKLQINANGGPSGLPIGQCQGGH
jgi:hypothetical protein